MKITIDEKLCKGCGFCMEVCPKGIFKESNSLNKKGYEQPEVVNPESCINCKKCELICPEMAINIKTDEEGK